MNKKLFFASLLFACFFSISHSQLLLNQYSGHFLDSASYGIQGTCLPDADFYFSNMDPNYDSIATGTEVVVILTSITSGIQVSGQNLNAGDTIRFDTSNYIEVRSAYPGVVNFQYWMVGTPTVPNEPYTCGVFISFTLAECGNTVIPFNNGAFCAR